VAAALEAGGARPPNRIRELRHARGLSLQKVADAANCSKVQVSDLERGRVKLNLRWMQRLAPALGVLPVDILNIEDQGPRLSEKEMTFLQSYRALDEKQQRLFQRLVAVICAEDMTP
jgi:transcriptional regulator with XRE-family HTH domain